MIDLNRASDDIDWEMVSGGGAYKPVTASTPARAGRAAGWGWRAATAGVGGCEMAAGARRPGSANRPGACALSRGAVRPARIGGARWVPCLLIDLHSMPPLPARAGEMAAEFVLATVSVRPARHIGGRGVRLRLAAGARLAHTTGPMQAAMCWSATLGAPKAFIVCSWSSTGGSISDPGWRAGAGLADTVDVVTALVQRMAIAVADLGREARTRTLARGRRATSMRAIIEVRKTTWSTAPGGQGSGRRCTRSTAAAGP